MDEENEDSSARRPDRRRPHGVSAICHRAGCGPSAPTALADTIAIGEPIYARRCQECHGAKGGGFVGPKLSGNERLANAEFVIRQITNGSADMPAFGKRLTPEELLAVGTYGPQLVGQ